MELGIVLGLYKYNNVRPLSDGRSKFLHSLLHLSESSICRGYAICKVLSVISYHDLEARKSAACHAANVSIVMLHGNNKWSPYLVKIIVKLLQRLQRLPSRIPHPGQLL